MPFHMLPGSVVESGLWANLSHIEKAIYMTLCIHYNRKERRAFPGRARMAKMNGCSVRHVGRALEGLKRRGVIVIKKRDNPNGLDSNDYILPDMLLQELEFLSKEPEKFGKDIYALARDILALPRDTMAPAKDADVSDQGHICHTNYIINQTNNYYTKIENSFNKTVEKAEVESITNELPGSDRIKEWTREETAIKDNALKEFYEQIGNIDKVK